MITFDVLGTPAPKGSSRAAMFGGRAHIIPNSSTANAAAQRAWVNAVHDAALALIAPMFENTALRVTIAFHVERPKSVKLSKRPMPSTRPDVDKTARCTLDALTGILFDDDSRICDLMLSKRWAETGREGATITVEVAR